jgi:hypothetical protein
VQFERRTEASVTVTVARLRPDYASLDVEPIYIEPWIQQAQQLTSCHHLFRMLFWFGLERTEQHGSTKTAN